MGPGLDLQPGIAAAARKVATAESFGHDAFQLLCDHLLVKDPARAHDALGKHQILVIRLLNHRGQPFPPA